LKTWIVVIRRLLLRLITQKQLLAPDDEFKSKRLHFSRHGLPHHDRLAMGRYATRRTHLQMIANEIAVRASASHFLEQATALSCRRFNISLKKNLSASRL
jgi:hypothetical protein